MFILKIISISRSGYDFLAYRASQEMVATVSNFFKILLLNVFSFFLNIHQMMSNKYSCIIVYIMAKSNLLIFQHTTYTTGFFPFCGININY